VTPGPLRANNVQRRTGNR